MATQTVIVTPSAISIAHEMTQKFLEESDQFAIEGLPTTDEPRPDTGEKVTVTVSGSKDSVTYFCMSVASFSRFPKEKEDLTMIDMRDNIDRFNDLSQNRQWIKDGKIYAEIHVTWPEYEQTEIKISDY